MQKLDVVDSKTLQARTARARAEREAVIVSLVEDEQKLLDRRRSLHADHYDQVSADLDVLESDVRLCTRTLNAREWAKEHIRAGHLPVRREATTSTDRYEPGFLTRMLLRCVLGPATGSAA